LLIVAAPVEARAVARGFAIDFDPVWWRPHALREDVDVLVTGVGKANSAAATMYAAHSGEYACCVNLGICGALPNSGLSLGDVLVADRSVYADEGVETPSSFDSIASLGFPPGLGDVDSPEETAMAARADAGLLAVLEQVATRVGGIATVSTCSGTDALALAIELRTGALGEAMEGAAIGLTLANLATAGHHASPVPFIEMRTVSNTTGKRESQTWDFPGAFARLSDVAARL
jgi:futalosine hydrolase